MTFNGSLLELKALVQQLGVACHWEHKGTYELCVFDDGASNLRLNWWPSTGALTLVGDPEQRLAVEPRLAERLADCASSPPAPHRAER